MVVILIDNSVLARRNSYLNQVVNEIYTVFKHLTLQFAKNTR